MENVRKPFARALGVERGALANAEAMLFVDDGDDQRRELTVSSISAWVPTTS